MGPDLDFLAYMGATEGFQRGGGYVSSQLSLSLSAALLLSLAPSHLVLFPPAGLMHEELGSCGNPGCEYVSRVTHLVP